MGQARLAPACGASDCVRCLGWRAQRTGRSRENEEAPRLKFTGLSGEPRANGHLHQWSTAAQLERTKS
jgi:hypothetical protein